MSTDKLIVKAGHINTDASYRFLRSLFAQSVHWNDWDPFLSQKMKTFQQSEASILRRPIDAIFLLCRIIYGAHRNSYHHAPIGD